jgi:hypothetical protein
VRSKNGGRLKEKYLELTGRMSKAKSAAALARRIITLMWALVTRREFYKDITEAELRKKTPLLQVRLHGMAWHGRHLPLDNNHRSHCGGRGALAPKRKQSCSAQLTLPLIHNIINLLWKVSR